MKRRVIRLLALVLATAACSATRVLAQSEGHVSIGVGATTIRPHDPELRPTSFINPIVRLNPGKGFGLAGALDWFDSDLGGSFDGVGAIQVRPLMGGVGYGWHTGELWTSVSIVGGPAFNRIRLNDSARDRFQLTESQRITFAVRPGVSVTYDVAPKVGITAFAGYLFNRPQFTLHTIGSDVRTAGTTDAAVLSVGVVYSPF